MSNSEQHILLKVRLDQGSQTQCLYVAHHMYLCCLRSFLKLIQYDFFIKLRLIIRNSIFNLPFKVKLMKKLCHTYFDYIEAGLHIQVYSLHRDPRSLISVNLRPVNLGWRPLDQIVLMSRPVHLFLQCY